MVCPCHEENGESTLRVVMKLKMKGKRPRGRRRLYKVVIDNINNHLKGKNTYPKEVLENKCFENRQDWRTLISRPTDRSSGEDP